MKYAAYIQSFDLGNTTVQLYVPEEAIVQEKYLLARQNDAATIFPYWAKLWPSSVALCKYMVDNASLFTNQKVLELAAGLGLPSMLAAKFCEHVICSDYASEALPWMQASVTLNKLQNVETMLIDWNHFPENISADIVLLSDINYDPVQFGKLYALIRKLLQNNVQIILATPQRLIAKSFIEQLLPYCIHQQLITVSLQGEQTDISLFRLSYKHETVCY